MKILGIICLIIVVLDIISTPLKYMYDRMPRPAWKKSYALRFAIVSVITDCVLVYFSIAVIRHFW